MTAEEIKEHRKKCTCVDQVNDTMCAKCGEETGSVMVGDEFYDWCQPCGIATF